MSPAPATFRLILWPSLLTLAISITRLVGEQQGWVTDESGGAGALLGISWCIPLFGGWFGWRLARAGSFPRGKKPWLWALLATLAFVGTMAYGFRPLLHADKSDATFELVRAAVLHGVLVGLAGACAMFFVWPRLACTLLLYGLGARATVVAITWYAKSQDLHTHHVKFGPPGIERDSMQETMVSACLAQFGAWVPLTIFGGMLVGCLCARRPK